MAAKDIILGEGVFSVGSTDIALTRGGGKLVIEREYRQIEADGDRGPVKERVRLVKSVAKLTLNTLEMLPANLIKLYPATQLDTATEGHTKWKGKADVELADYQDTVKFTGKTKGGKPVIITLQNALNLENIDWAMVSKDEVVPQIVYTATYLHDSRTTEPWEIDIDTTV